MLRILIGIIIGILFFTSCKSAKNTAHSLPNLSTKSIIKKNKKATQKEQSLKASIVVKYKGKDQLPSLNASLRMVKDSIIWMSFSKLGFPVGKIKIEPQRVQFYEKINRTYFDGDFELISEWLGTTFNFSKIQHLFLGEPLYELRAFKWDKTITPKAYELKAKEHSLFFDLMYLIDAQNFKLVEEEIADKKSTKKLTVRYPDYQKINESLLPKRIVIQATEKESSTTIDINFKSTSNVRSKKFPFSIPEGYKRIELKNAEK